MPIFPKGETPNLNDWRKLNLSGLFTNKLLPYCDYQRANKALIEKVKLKKVKFVIANILKCLKAMLLIEFIEYWEKLNAQ